MKDTSNCNCINKETLENEQVESCCGCAPSKEYSEQADTCCCTDLPGEKPGIMHSIYKTLSSLPAIIISGTFTAASLTLHYAGHGLGIHLPVDPAWVAVAVSGYPLLYNAINKLIKGRGVSKISSSLLISIAMLAAISIGEIFAAGQVAFIMAIGGFLEYKTTQRARRGIRKLINLIPESGRVIFGDEEKIIPINEVKTGDILRVLPGEAVPVDGEIISGNTSVDQSIITGESLPVDKAPGDNVHQGTINCFGVFQLRATTVGADSSLNKLISLVREADRKKAPTQLIVDKWAVWLVPLTLLIAVITYVITRNIEMAVTIMIVFCPCALALATPTAIMAAIGQAAKHGVLIKSGEALEKMGKVNIIAFDKTGTLTHGNLVVSDIVSFSSDITESKLLSLAASVESHSEHPLGRAVTMRAREDNVPVQPIINFEMFPGKGVLAETDNAKIICGNSSFLQESSVEINDDIEAKILGFRNQGKAVVLVSQDGVCIGALSLSDTIKAEASGIISALKKEHTDSVLISGDNEKTALYFAGMAGIDTVYADLLPEQKVEKISELQAQGRYVCMIGDGVNDAPALKSANVGVAMGSFGSDIAIDAADIALMGDDISNIPYLKRLSNKTVRMILTNISFAIVFNVAAITLSMFGLLNPVTGALAHNAGSIAVVLNAALLYDRKC